MGGGNDGKGEEGMDSRVRGKKGGERACCRSTLRQAQGELGEGEEGGNCGWGGLW